MEAFTFAVSTQVDFPIHVKIGSLEGKQKQAPFSLLMRHPELRHIGSAQNPVSDLFVTIQLWSDSKALGVPLQTSYKAFKSARAWNEWLQMPISIKDAPLKSQLAITVWDLSPFGGEGALGHYVPFGGTTIPLFDGEGKLKMGRQKCKIYRHRAADGFSSTTTPSTPPPKRRKTHAPDPLGPSEEEMELERIEVLIKKHEMGEIPRIDWMDQLVFRQLERLKLNAEEAARKRALRLKATKQKRSEHGGDEDDSDDNEVDDENFILYVEFPRFDHPIVWSDHEYPAPPMSSYSQGAPANANPALKPVPEVRFGPGIEGADGGGVIRIYDPEVGQTGNPCEDKHRRLIRSHRTGIMDRDLKPNPKIRDELNVILSYEPTQDLTAEEKDLIWRFRYYLTREKRALTKFVKSVNWRDVGEAHQAVEILPKWTEIDVDDALELLGPTFDNPAVRSYAVERLRKADDEELLLYLLQLVQALKYEEHSHGDVDDAAHDSSLANFLIARAANNFKLGNYLHWYLMVECDDAGPGTLSAQRRLFARVEYYFMAELEKVHPEHRKTLLRQGELVTVLTKIAKDVRFSRENRVLKIERLKQCLKDPKNDMLHIEPPLPLPLDPEIQVTGCYPDEANVFKSSLSPLQVMFKTSDGRKFPILEPLGVRKETMDTYIKSCAGYCVITYLLGVGDRHLENLLLAPDGHFFHADFGFILGRDPKPFAPMMKLCKEMVEGMGGTTSPLYLQFKQYCFTAYTTLRKSANLILNLFSLMVDANIPDIRVEPDKAVLKVKERFHLEMSEEEAIRHFEQLISDSVNAIFGVVIDRLHEFVQGWRA
ncbi:putative integral membrane protein [Aspergillus niger]|uniref:Phosphatidylinositol 3-kinase VPS34 n=1 Tax=Aspergillus niger TaxID=5061 RepID=A0A505I8E8_ASPNG|nr:putative integral membrane protein [Aspergillus niger]